MKDIVLKLQNHPNVNSIEEIDLRDLPKRVSTSKSFLSCAFNCSVQVGEIEYELVLGLPKTFPKILPYFFLSSPEKHDFHNHINFVGEVCYTDKNSSIFINTDNLDAVLQQALDQTTGVLKSSYNRDLTDLLEEFEGYWRSLPGCMSIDCFHDPGNEAIQIKLLTTTSKHNKITPILCFSDSLPQNYGFTKKLGSNQNRNGLYLPLDSSVLPPNMDSGLTPRYVTNLFKALKQSKKQKIVETLKKLEKRKNKREKHRNEFIIFSHPRPSGAKALFGIHLSGCSMNQFLLSDNPDNWKASPIEIIRHYRKYLTERGGAHNSIYDLSVAICGCGAVGSRIAEQLGLAGIGNITVIDNDLLSADNIHRHVLGGEYIGDNKADAMAKHLSQRLPYIKVTPVPITREKWLSQKNEKNIDIIIDATADLTGLRELNIQFYKKTSPPVIYCWLEACGIGGHAILVDYKISGCVECLINREPKGMYFRNSFLVPFQVISKDLTGCGSGFTPFSSLDAIKTATLASEMALDYILKREQPCYRFWIGDDSLAKSENLGISEWYYKASKINPDLDSSSYTRPSCSACGRHI